MYGHDYENGHTCPTCGKTGIPCTIEDGFCENAGDCDRCIKQGWLELSDEQREYLEERESEQERRYGPSF